MAADPRKKKPRAMDPQCGKAVDPAQALRMDWEGRSYYFCSERCRKAFDLDPPGDAGF